MTSIGLPEARTVVNVLATGSRDFWHRPTIRLAFEANMTAAEWNRSGPYRFRLIEGECPLRYVDLDLPDAERMVDYPDPPAGPARLFRLPYPEAWAAGRVGINIPGGEVPVTRNGERVGTAISRLGPRQATYLEETPEGDIVERIGAVLDDWDAGFPHSDAMVSTDTEPSDDDWADDDWADDD